MKKGGWIILCALLAVAAWWWTHRAQYSPGEEFLAIPAEVDLVSAHDQPAERLPELTRNPVIRLALQASETDMEGLDAFMNDPTQLKALSALLSKRLVVARLPDPDNPEGTWLAVSWIGRAGHQFNFLANMLAGDALEQIDHPAGYTLWKVRDADEQAQTYLAVDGELLLLSIGADESGLLRMLDTVALKNPSLDPAVLFGAGAVAGPYPDRAVFRTTHNGEVFVTHLDIQQANSTNLTLQLAFPNTIPGDDVAAPDPKLIESYHALVGDRARLGLMMPAEYAEALGAAYLSDEWGDLTQALFSRLDTRPVFLSVFDGDMGGQLNILRTPSLTIALPVAGPEEGEALMQDILLELNARLPFNLFNEAVAGREHTWAIGSAARNPYRSLGGDERAGYRVVDNWLVLSSSLRTLRKFPVGASDTVSHAVDPGWGLIYGWIDFSASMKAVRNGLSMYMMGLAFDSSAKATELRSTLLMYRDWAELAGQCGQLQFSTQKVDKQLHLRVQQSTP